MDQIDFLGFTIKDSKVFVKSDQVEKIEKLAVPKNVKELRSLLGFLAFFKKFVPMYSERISPLLELLKKDAFKIGTEEEQCLDDIKKALIDTRGLLLPDFNKRFFLYADVSNFCLGAALTQMLNGDEHVLSWASKKLNQAEVNYTTTEKECLAIIWAVERFETYLYNEFTIRTDHSALTWL